MKKKFIVIIAFIMILILFFFTTKGPDFTGEYKIENILYLSSLSSTDSQVYKNENAGIKVRIVDSFLIEGETIYTNYSIEESNKSINDLKLIDSFLGESSNDLILNIGSITKLYDIVDQTSLESKYSLLKTEGVTYLIEYYDGKIVESIVTLEEQK